MQYSLRTVLTRPMGRPPAKAIRQRKPPAPAQTRLSLLTVLSSWLGAVLGKGVRPQQEQGVGSQAKLGWPTGFTPLSEGPKGPIFMAAM